MESRPGVLNHIKICVKTTPKFLHQACLLATTWYWSRDICRNLWLNLFELSRIQLMLECCLLSALDDVAFKVCNIACSPFF